MVLNYSRKYYFLSNLINFEFDALEFHYILSYIVIFNKHLIEITIADWEISYKMLKMKYLVLYCVF